MFCGPESEHQHVMSESGHARSGSLSHTRAGGGTNMTTDPTSKVRLLN